MALDFQSMEDYPAVDTFTLNPFRSLYDLRNIWLSVTNTENRILVTNSSANSWFNQSWIEGRISKENYKQFDTRLTFLFKIEILKEIKVLGFETKSMATLTSNVKIETF